MQIGYSLVLYAIIADIETREFRRRERPPFGVHLAILYVLKMSVQNNAHHSIHTVKRTPFE